jgi:hypothetical protein
MRALSRILLILLATAAGADAQNKSQSFLAYVHVILVDVAHQSSFDGCVIVGADGRYHYEIEPPAGQPAQTKTKVYRGTLAPTVFDQFRSLVQAPELRGLQSSQPRGSMVATRSRETVSLRIHRTGETQEVVFTTVDNRDSMPPSVGAFIPWMVELPKSLGRPDRRSAPRNCSGLDLTSDFTPELQKR